MCVFHVLWILLTLGLVGFLFAELISCRFLSKTFIQLAFHDCTTYKGSGRVWMILAPSSPVIGLCHKVIWSQNHPTATLTTGSQESSSKPWLIPHVKSQGTLLKGRKPPEECTRVEHITIGHHHNWQGRPVSWFGHNILRLKSSHNTYHTDVNVRILSFLIEFSCQATPSISPLSCLPNLRPQLRVRFFLGL